MIEIEGRNYLSTIETAEHLSCSTATVRAWCAKGLIPGAIKASQRSSWLIPKEALDVLNPPRLYKVGGNSHGQTERVP